MEHLSMGSTMNSRSNETFVKLLRLNTIVLMTHIVTCIAILITSQPPPATHTRARTHHTTLSVTHASSSSLRKSLFFADYFI